MKRLIILLAVVAATMTFSSPKASAQTIPFSQGDIMATAYAGVPDFATIVIPPVGIGAQYGIKAFGGGDYGVLGVGGAADFGLTSYYDGYSRKMFLPFQISAFASYNYFFTDSFGVHAKSGLGLYLNKYYSYASISYFPLSYYEFIGVDFFFNPNFGVTAEVGYSALSYLHVGINYVF